MKLGLIQLAGFALAFGTSLLVRADDPAAQSSASEAQRGPQRLEAEYFDPEIVDVPGLQENYGMVYDLNHALLPDIRFLMEQVIDPDRGVYRTEGLMADPKTGEMPNWFIMFKMQNCYYCEVLEPAM